MKSYESHINNTWPFAKEGLPFICISFGFTFLFLFLDLKILSIFGLILSIFVVYFFRDPERGMDAPDDAVMTPADGKIIRIERIENGDNPLSEPAIKVSIFMSIFNVHVNRIPVAGTIKGISYHPGKFFSADLDKASEQNEHNKITLETHNSQRVVFIQIAGLIARRIACWVKEEEEVNTSQRFGLIRFGSRLDVFLPYKSVITIELSQKVKAGKTIIGHLT